MNSKWYLYQCPQNRRSNWICHPKTWWSFNYKASKRSIAVPCKNSLFLKFSGNDHILLLSSFFHWWPNISGFWNVSDTVLSFYRTLIAKLRLKGHVFSMIGIWPCNLPSFEPGEHSVCSVVLTSGQGPWKPEPETGILCSVLIADVLSPGRSISQWGDAG